MHMHRTICTSFLAFSFCVPLLSASQDRNVAAEPIYWLTAPDQHPDSFLKKKRWQARDAFSRAALPTAHQKNEGVQPKAWPAAAPDPFTAAFFSGQEPDWKDHHPEAPPAEPFEAPPPRPTQQPSIFASQSVGIVFFVLGIAGWIALAVSAFVLDRRRGPHDSRSS